jgi:hypothetical protein
MVTPRKAGASPTGAAPAAAPVKAGHVRAVALVGFYRGVDLVQPGQVLDLPELEFIELFSFHKVEGVKDGVA